MKVEIQWFVKIQSLLVSNCYSWNLITKKLLRTIRTKLEIFKNFRYV